MTTTKEPPAAATQGIVTKNVLVNVILDRSGSMEKCKAGTISGYNEYLKGLRADKDSEYNVSLIQFDSPSHGPELTVSYTDRPLAEVPDLNGETYEPRGMTPLYDAIGECVRRVDVKDRGVLTVIITDGYENASHEFSRETIKKLIGEKEAEGWKFLFLGANIDSAAVGGSMGIAAMDCADYAVGKEKALYNTMAMGTMRFAGAVRSHGTRSMQAKAAAAPTPRERTAMLGGRPAAPPPFRTTKVQSNPEPKLEDKRTQWAVRS